MTVMIKVLVVEDSENDVELLMRQLRKGGYTPRCSVVETAESFKKALEYEPWDLILCDYKMPNFSAPAALKIIQEMNFDIPFLVVSGTIGEDTAIEIMKAGAHDYLMKDKLTRLPAAVERELRDAKNREHRKEAENLWKKSEDNFRHSLDESPLGIRIISTKGQTIYANQEILNIYGYESLEEFNSIPHRARYTPETMVEYEKRKATRQTGNDGPPNYEISIIRKDGQIRHLEVFRKRVLWNGNIEYQALYNDITKRKHAEYSLLESEERYRTVVENAHESILITQDAKIVFANRSAVRDSGYSYAELLNLEFEKFIHEDDRGMVVNLYWRRLQGEYLDPNYEFRIICKDGSVKWVELNVTIIEWNKKPATLNFLKDITERKLLDEEVNKSYRQTREALNATVNSIAMIVENRDPYTTGHQKRVSILAEAIASEMGLAESQKDFIATAAIMHDIGKISIPSEILSKPSKLSDIEYDLIKTHSESGHNILKDIHFPWPVAQVILQHHERINGSGYPHNLKGNEILLEARIIAVADVVEAISSHRPYRATLGIDYALNEISQNRGILYDSDIVDACLRLFREKNFSLT